MELNFDHRTYVPLLRWKPAELAALTNLPKDVRANVRPILELLPTSFAENPNRERTRKPAPKPEEIIDRRVWLLGEAMGSEPVLVDLWHLPEDMITSRGDHLWDALSASALERGMRLIPTTGFRGRGKASQARIGRVAGVHNCGCAIRLRQIDLVRPGFSDEIADLLQILGTNEGSTDLVIDLQYLSAQIPSYASLISRIPRLNTWRSLTVLAGSFPVDLSHLKANDIYRIERQEWNAWRMELQRGFGSTFRMPAFGDYTIQHGVYKEPVAMPHVSASIRYTVDSEWVVFRGEWIGKRGGAGCAQYPAEAQLLVEMPEFSGKDFSFGDDFILAKSKDGRKPGNATQWLTAGINHHVALATHQVRTAQEALVPTRRADVETEKVLRR